MAKHSVVTVTSLSEFTHQIETCLAAARQASPGINRFGNWYRGHGMRGFLLRPSLYRHPTIKDCGALLDLEAKMVSEFRRQGTLHEIPSLGQGEQERFETLFYMQHYGVPTRLLDWTSNPFIALYFALTDAGQSKNSQGYSDDASVWILDPWKWNESSMVSIGYGLKGPATPEMEDVTSYRPRQAYTPHDKARMYDNPVAILGVSNNARMFAQKGVFTIFGKSTLDMDVVYDQSGFAQDSLKEILIPKANIGNLLDNLLSIGYTDSVAYPDHQGLALEIKRLNGFLA